MRFIKDCEEWYGRKILTARSEKYASPLDVASKQIFNTPYGAPCTYELKKKVRQKIQNRYVNFTHVFGFEYTPREIDRAQRWTEQNTKNVVFPLIENKLNKKIKIINKFYMGAKKNKKLKTYFTTPPPPATPPPAKTPRGGSFTGPPAHGSSFC